MPVDRGSTSWHDRGSETAIEQKDLSWTDAPGIRLSKRDAKSWSLLKPSFNYTVMPA